MSALSQIKIIRKMAKILMLFLLIHICFKSCFFLRIEANTVNASSATATTQEECYIDIEPDGNNNPQSANSKTISDVLFEFIGPLFATFLGVVTGGFFNKRKERKEALEKKANLKLIKNMIDEELDTIQTELYKTSDDVHHIYVTPIWDEIVSGAILLSLDSSDLKSYLTKYKDIGLAKAYETMWIDADAETGKDKWLQTTKNKAIELREQIKGNTPKRCSDHDC